MTVLRLEDVDHRYGDRQVLHGIDLTLSEHRIGIVGANGSGKSTLARLLNGLVEPTSGRVLIDGLDTRTDGPAIRRRVGFVFTDPDAQIIMPTVAEDVAFSLRRAKLSKAEVAERVNAALARVGLDAHADHPAHLLSGGQKQLLALTSVLVSSPEVLVCDEPTTLLDLRNARAIGELLASLPQQVVLVTHHLDAVASFDRVIVIDHGRVVADGPAEQSLATYRAIVG